MTEEETKQVQVLVQQKCKQVSIQFLEYIMLNNGMIQEKFNKEEMEQVLDEYNNFIQN